VYITGNELSSQKPKKIQQPSTSLDRIWRCCCCRWWWWYRDELRHAAQLS